METQQQEIIKELQDKAAKTNDELVKAAIEKKIEQIKKPFTK